MGKLKQVFCKHKYEFFPEKVNGLMQRVVRGFCPKCEKQVEFSHKEYKEYLKENNIENQG